MEKTIRDLINQSEAELEKGTRVGRMLGEALKRQYVDLIKSGCKPDDDLGAALAAHPDCHLKIIDKEREEKRKKKGSSN